MAMRQSMVYIATLISTLCLWLMLLPVGIAADFTLTDKERAWLTQQGEIRVGVMNAWPPFNFVNNHGQPQGIGQDYIAALNRRLGGVLKPISGTWQQIYRDTQERRLDALLDITPKPEREAYFNFTTPYLDIPHVIVARKNIAEMANEHSLRGKTIALERGFGNVHYFKQHYPSIRVKEYDNTYLALDAVARGEVDAYAGNRSVALYIINQELMTTLKVHGRLMKTGSVLAIGTLDILPALKDGDSYGV